MFVLASGRRRPIQYFALGNVFRAPSRPRRGPQTVLALGRQSLSSDADRQYSCGGMRGFGHHVLPEAPREEK
jgi:hypothetical protein